MPQETIDEDRLIKRLIWRLMPLLTIMFLVSFIDRQNVGFAKLQMVSGLKTTEAAYGFASSLFFIAYLVFEIPSTLAVHKYGARFWMARIMLTWGVVTVLQGFCQSLLQFDILRCLLGVAEAGLYPGILFYLTLWFPQRHRTRVLGLFTLGSACANALGSLLGGPLLDLDGTFGLAGWQWVFIVTGAPPIILTFIVWKFLPSGPEEAKFLSPAEKTWLSGRLAAEKETTVTEGNPYAALWDWRVLGFALTYMMMSTSLYGVSYWLPTVVKGFGVSSSVNGLLNTLPWALSACMLAWLPARLRRDRTMLRAVTIIAICGVVCFVASTQLPSNALRFVALVLGAPCIQLLYPCFWSMPPRFFSGARAAASLAAINSIGNLGGFWGQNLMPQIATMTGSTILPMLLPAACLTVLGIAAFVARQRLGDEPARSAV
ncbi:MAG TPA: MFS transporter [Aliidongia sp.]|uniref:MFS transporter n=1 Tax=Aliidongia sp. TaxID=1914230 RepID=UPI002DDCBEA6|nr:MFS transporter [Aliidongia sp.]HEV2673638.1 MFS transporter [Aliidongia sp.]